MNKRLVKTLLAAFVSVVLLTTGRVAGENGEKGSRGELDVRQLLSGQQTERTPVLEGLITEYDEVSRALLGILGEANAKFRTDRRYHSPLHCAILAVDTWHVLAADTLLLSMIDYELDLASLPDGIDVPGDYFYPAASALVRLRVDTAKVEKSLAAAENPKTLRILTWVLLEREKDVERAKTALANASSKSHDATEKQNINKAIELLENPSDLLPPPSRGDHPSSS